MTRFLAYLKRVVTAFDVLCNVATGGLPDETLSARFQRNQKAVGGPFFSHAMSIWLTWLQPHHGARAVEHDLERAQKVAELEAKTQKGES